MKNVKFTAEFKHAVDDRTTKTWPAGWTGELPIEIADTAIEKGAAEEIVPEIVSGAAVAAAEDDQE